MTEHNAMSRRRLLAAGTGLGAAAAFGIGFGVADAAGRPAGPSRVRPGLDIRSAGYPRAWFFRQTEDSQEYASYAEWEAQYRHLDGIQGKAFGEERDFDYARTREFFSRFRQDHPEQVVLLHFNGKGRRWSFNGGAFSAGHWLYYAGTSVTASAGTAATTLHVADASRFRMERPPVFEGMPDDVVIVPRVGGALDWAGAEQTRLAGVDYAANTIAVQRGQFGTSPIEVAEGAYVAAHVRERPPRLPPPNSLWLYNFSQIGPRDEQGRRCIEVLADELAGYFAEGGELAAYDGVEFDVMFFIPDGRPQGVRFAMDQELIDIDNDGVPDAEADHGPGFTGGANVYGIGVTEFCVLLRDYLPDRYLMADGMMPAVLQRSVRALSGIESEGFPYLRDPDFADWSGGLNRFEFWRGRGTRPRLNYQVFKYLREENKPGIDPDAYRRLRLALAGAQFTDSCFALGEGWAPPPVPWQDGVEVRVFDELWLGQEQQSNWLGLPVGDPVHLAASTPDLLRGRKASRPVAAGVSPDTGAPLVDRNLGEVELAGTDLYAELRISGERLPGYPLQIARRLALRVLPAGGGDPVGEVFSWFDDQVNASTFAFRDIGPGRFQLVLRVEGDEPIALGPLSAHDHPDVMYREFEHGVVLANPSTTAYTFDLAGLLPDKSYRRILGSNNQDPQTNNGQPVGTDVTVGPIDGLFLLRTA